MAVTLRAFTARWTSRSAAPAASTSAEAASADTDTAGIDTPTGPRSVGLRMWSGSAPGYATIRALAPAACAFSSWSRRKHWPGCTSATSPAGNSAKSDAEHPPPLRSPGGAEGSTPTAVTGASTSPAAEYRSGLKSRSSS